MQNYGGAHEWEMLQSWEGSRSVVGRLSARNLRSSSFPQMSHGSMRSLEKAETNRNGSRLCQGIKFLDVGN